MRGRKPQPAAAKAVKAAVRSRRKPPVVVETPVVVGEVQPPAKLGALAVQVWNALAPQLVASKLLTALDVPAFGRYCRLTARFEQAARTIDDEGLTYESVSAHGTLKRFHPAAMLEMRYSRELASLEASFGLNPGDRQRIFAERARIGGQGTLFPGEQKPAAEDASAARTDQSPIGILQ
jgi:P27 family predicted phage terminase small subunit